MSRHQDRDDLMSSPVRFITMRPDGCVQKVFEIRPPHDPMATWRLGELIVHETIDGPLVKIQTESEEWLRR